MAQPGFITIAGSSLEQLSYQAIVPGDDPDFVQCIDWLKVAALTALTKLEITDYASE